MNNKTRSFHPALTPDSVFLDAPIEKRTMGRPLPLAIAGLRRVLIAVVTLVTAAILVGAQVLHTQMLGEERVSLDYHIDGTASKPFAFRVLIPKILKSIEAVTPRSMAQVFDRFGHGIVAFGPLPANVSGLDQPRLRSGPDDRYPRAIFWLVVL